MGDTSLELNTINITPYDLIIKAIKTWCNMIKVALSNHENRDKN